MVALVAACEEIKRLIEPENESDLEGLESLRVKRGAGRGGFGFLRSSIGNLAKSNRRQIKLGLNRRKYYLTLLFVLYLHLLSSPF